MVTVFISELNQQCRVPLVVTGNDSSESPLSSSPPDSVLLNGKMSKCLLKVVFNID